MSSIVEFMCPRVLVDRLFAMQWKIEDGARSHGLGDKGGKGLPLGRPTWDDFAISPLSGFRV